ncbi:hypothetical protein HO173_012801 [Letharia columbiana]|uniref:Uncharacterized protein n=1 Tax=Letharia columbiana TaxID=112416 RepID=A0A8H6FEX8_9LECA|nr:uncharacterized protein HO173_012801 [Letharia columbiana]KAF6225363.1 hypothetical protein HO173_012801 [Letharia columbiana]
MATTAVTTRAYPKRKRAEISYHESSSDEVEVDDEYGASDGKLTARSRKKLKASHTAVSTKTLPKRNIFPFTSLPAELKNQIYALSLIDPDGIFLISKTKQYRRTIQRSVPYTVNSSGKRLLPQKSRLPIPATITSIEHLPSCHHTRPHAQCSPSQPHNLCRNPTHPLRRQHLRC